MTHDGAPGLVSCGAEEEGGDGSAESAEDPEDWDADVKREWDAFVRRSKVGQGRMWSAEDVDEGLPQVQIKFDRD